MFFGQTREITSKFTNHMESGTPPLYLSEGEQGEGGNKVEYIDLETGKAGFKTWTLLIPDNAPRDPCKIFVFDSLGGKIWPEPIFPTRE